MSQVESGWFREMNDQWEGYSVGLKIEKVLFEGKSQYQDILVFKRYLILLVCRNHK